MSAFLSSPYHAAFAAEPVRLILDTDMGNDCDDALALGMIHALENRGEVHLLAVTITKDNRNAAAYIDLVDTFYGRPDIPIGLVRNGKTPNDTPMLKVPVERRDAQGQLVYPDACMTMPSFRKRSRLLTHVLKEQPDGSVTIAQIGFSTNLARLVVHAGRQSAGGAQSQGPVFDGRQLSRSLSPSITSLPTAPPLPIS